MTWTVGHMCAGAMALGVQLVQLGLLVMMLAEHGVSNVRTSWVGEGPMHGQKQRQGRGYRNAGASWGVGIRCWRARWWYPVQAASVCGIGWQTVGRRGHADRHGRVVCLVQVMGLVRAWLCEHGGRCNHGRMMVVCTGRLGRAWALSVAL